MKNPDIEPMTLGNMRAGRRCWSGVGLSGKALAMVRSECINIVAANSAGLCGRIDSISFAGDRQRLTARGAAERPPSIDAANLFCVEVGERVDLAIDFAAIRLLLGDGA